jgi:hypothetical protein
MTKTQVTSPEFLSLRKAYDETRTVGPVSELQAFVRKAFDAASPFTGRSWSAQLEKKVVGSCERVVAALLAGDLSSVPAVMALCWPTGNPDVDDPSWWRTSLGLLCTDGFVTDTSKITQEVAANILGITKGSIGVMQQRGNLPRHKAGGVVRGDVMARLSAKRQKLSIAPDRA